MRERRAAGYNFMVEQLRNWTLPISYKIDDGFEGIIDRLLYFTNLFNTIWLGRFRVAMKGTTLQQL